MITRLLVPAAASLALLAGAFSAPASAQPWGYDQQGGGGAGPYALPCKRYHNYHARERCTQEVMNWGYERRHRYRAPYYGYYDEPGYYPGYDNGGFYPYYGGY